MATVSPWAAQAAMSRWIRSESALSQTHFPIKFMALTVMRQHNEVFLLSPGLLTASANGLCLFIVLRIKEKYGISRERKRSTEGDRKNTRWGLVFWITGAISDLILGAASAINCVVKWEQQHNTCRLKITWRINYIKPESPFVGHLNTETLLLLTGSWPDCALVRCESRSHEASCQSSRYQSHK